MPAGRGARRLRARGARARRQDDPLVRPGAGLRAAARAGSRSGTASTRTACSSRTASLQGFVLLAQRLAPGKRVLVESPTYDRPLKILRELGADVVPLAMRRRRARSPTRSSRRSRASPAPAFLYSIPTFQNPSGRTLARATPPARSSSSRRQHDLLVLEDDPYGLDPLRGRGAAVALRPLGRTRRSTPRRSRRRSRPGCASAGSSFPEALAAPRSRRRELDLHHARCCSGRRSSTSSSGAAASSRTSCASTGSCKRAPRRDARRRSTSTCPGARWSQPDGGYFIWLELPEGTSAQRAARAGRGRHLRARHRLRRRRRHAPPRVQLRLARRDRRRASRGSPRRSESRRQASLRRRGCGRHAAERHEPRLGRRLRVRAAARKVGHGRSRPARRGRGGGSSSRRRSERSVGSSGSLRGAFVGGRRARSYDRASTPQRACLNGKRAVSGNFEPAENCRFLVALAASVARACNAC